MKALLFILFAAMAVILTGCSSLSSSDRQSERIAVYRRYPVGRILYSDASDAAKLQQLRPYVRVGAKPSKRLSAVAGVGPTISHGVGFGEAFLSSGLELRFYPDGVVYGIGYVLPAAGSGADSTHWLVTETELQWPRGTRNPRYRLLHQ